MSATVTVDPVMQLPSNDAGGYFKPRRRNPDGIRLPIGSCHLHGPAWTPVQTPHGCVALLRHLHWHCE